MIASIKEGEIELFRKAYRRCDLLIIDHVEIIAGRRATMEEFYELFDHVFVRGGRIVIAGSKTPAMMRDLDDRIKTQLEAGIIQGV